jgi:C-3',4' desaturase CrtD
MKPAKKPSSKPVRRAIIIGAGIGGLTAAASLAKAGLDVTVLEAHIYPGGCAGTFYHQGYRFDAGATLAGGFYPGGPMDRVASSVGIAAWRAHPERQAMVVHLPDGTRVRLWSDQARWQERQAAFGPASEAFFKWQENRADALWDLALKLPPWPPQTPNQLSQLIGTGLRWMAEAPLQRMRPQIAADAFRPAAHHLRGAPDSLRQFIDGQLLISAQTTSRHANALYAASALDLPRRGVVHMAGGIGTIAEQLAEAVRRQGGKILYRQEVTEIARKAGVPVEVRTKHGGCFQADLVIANLPPWNIERLLSGSLPTPFRRLQPQPAESWGAFTLYVGLDSSSIHADFPLHHQVIVREPLGEGNSVFLSLSPAWDQVRAPKGRRALTISTHTNLAPWWDLFNKDRTAYSALKSGYTEKVLTAAEIAIPGLRTFAHLILPGTPVTFQRFTRRAGGWVGGFPQTSLLNHCGPRLDDDLWMVGDSIFPGQSIAAVALGGLRVAQLILKEGIFS